MRSPQRVTVRMYHVGFGDCFLVSADYGPAPGGGERHLLIDFGSKEASDDALARIGESIRDRTGGRIDVIVATHRHQDHISGFGTPALAPILDAWTPRAVLRPWTEDPEAAADAEKPRQTLARAIEFAGELSTTHFALERTDAGRDLHRLAAAQLANADAIGRLDGWSANSCGRYLRYGEDPKLDDVLPGIEASVLGPPSPEEWPRVAQQRGEDDEYWIALRATLPAALASLDEATERGTDAGSGHASDGPAPGPIGPTRWLTEKVRAQQAGSLLRLVRWLDDALNNTSLILLLTIGERRLLFPGDAQVENWEWALSRAPEVQRTRTRDELAKIDLYKVGHHGSRNATPKCSLYPLWTGRERPLVALLSTRSGMYGKREVVPNEDLLHALDSPPLRLVRTADDAVSNFAARFADVTAATTGDAPFELIP